MSTIIQFPATAARLLPIFRQATPAPKVKPLDEMMSIFNRKKVSSDQSAVISAREEKETAATPLITAHCSLGTLTKKQITARGEKALQTLRPFMGEGQRRTVEIALRGEEGEYFMGKMEELAVIVAAMPVTYETDGQGDDVICHLHYFGGPYDSWLTEKDMEEPEDPAEAQWQAHGFVKWAQNPDGSSGYICLPEILADPMINIDFDFKPTSLRDIKRKLGLLPAETPASDQSDQSDQSDPYADERHLITAPPADNAPVEPPPGKLHIYIERAEGFSEECGPHYYDSFALAWQCMQALGKTAPEGGGYDKTDVCVTFPDGKQWGYRYDLTRGGFDSQDGMDFPANLKQRLEFYAGRWTPQWMKAKGRVNTFIETPDMEAVALLDAWGDRMTLAPPACHAPAGESETVTDADLAVTMAILQQSYLTREQGGHGYGWQPGAVVVESWGHEQTNKDFYQITARKDQWLTLVALEAIQTRAKDPGCSTDAMRGTSLPGQSKQGVKPMRRRLDVYGSGNTTRAIAKGRHAFLHLWEGQPEAWTDYA